MTPWSALVSLVLLVLARTSDAHADTPLRVGSKRFTESYILAEILTASARAEGLAVRHEQGLGGTAIVFRALEQGAIDAYPDYTGTLAETTLKTGDADRAHLAQALEARGLRLSKPLGFENTYALAARREVAKRLGLSKLSNLAQHASSLKIGLSHEFAGRSDGFPGLAQRYGLTDVHPDVMDHSLAYEAIARGTIDICDVYTTDAKIARYGLVVLDDDLHFFPPYEAVFVVRADAASRFPALDRALANLAGTIDAPTMQRLNARAELDGVSFENVAADFLASRNGTASPTGEQNKSLVRGLLNVIVRHGPRHAELVVVSLALSVAVGLPLGVLAYRRRRAANWVLGAAGAIQTIPSLALFCFFIPLFGIGRVPALATLFLYGLLPIVRNTHAGLSSIPDNMRDAAIALGLSPSERLRHVELPLASRTILAGIKTSAVVAVGTATIAAFVGAGGFGDPISTGLALNDVPTILEGALPAALFAFLVEGVFAVLERAFG